MKPRSSTNFQRAHRIILAKSISSSYSTASNTTVPMVLTHAWCWNCLGQASISWLNAGMVVDYLGNLRGKPATKLPKLLNTSMPMALRTGVSRPPTPVHDCTEIVVEDLHTGNIVLVPSLKLYQTDADFMSGLGTPETGDVNARYGVPLTSRIPKYLVAPASTPSIASSPRGCSVKIVDFGGACLPEERREINCSLVVRAPEAVMTSRWGVQADVWSLGCTVRIVCRSERTS